MSLDVSLYEGTRTVECSECGHEHLESICVYTDNITHNLNKMAEAAGLYNVCWRPDENGYVKAKDILPILEQGFGKLIRDPDNYKQYNPSNGWGSYEGLLQFVASYILACKEHPEAVIRVSR